MSNAWIEIDADVLRANFAALRAAVAPSAEIVAVVKAEAYGHGAAAVARCGWACGVRWFAVAHLHEAAALRAQVPEARILVLGAVDPADTAAALELGVTPMIAGRAHGLAMAREAAALGRRLRGHAKIDTGMGRLGFLWEGAAEGLAELAREPGIEIEGVCTHFASADEPDSRFADTQTERFFRVLEGCRERGLRVACRHMSNSAGILRNRAWDLDAVRPGIMLYGYPPRFPGGVAEREPGRRDIRTRPFLQWKTRVAEVRRVPAGFPVSYGGTYVTSRPTTLATLNVGYSDGYFRCLGNRAAVLAGGRRCPVVGRVTMNLTVADLGPESGVQPGDDVTLLGQQGGEAIWADEIASWAGTIPYEVLTSIRTVDRRVSTSNVVRPQLRGGERRRRTVPRS